MILFDNDDTEEVLVALIAAILVLLFVPVQKRVSGIIRARRFAILSAPAILSAFFCAAAARQHALSVPLAVAVSAFVFAPTVVVMIGVPKPQGSWLDLAAILLLWLPLELGAGASLIPRAAQGTLHATIYGVAILLGLALFLLYRQMPGMRYNLPRRAGDFRNALLGWAVCAVVLIPLGLAIGFMQGPHAPPVSGARIPERIAFIFLGTALPEEILFRALIQNWIVQRFGESNVAIAAAALIFGAAHLDNGPQALPNWRYMIVATLAGFAFGKVFQKSTSVIASALTHAGVNTVKYLWF